MSCIEKAKQTALSLVGQGYIYGAKGQICSPAFRQQQAKQYPEWEKNILEIGAKWDGAPVWDCAQFTRAVAKAADLSFVSGATSQWNKIDWEAKGTIDTIPSGELVFLYRRQNGSSTVMAHTGISMGDGTCIHAKGTSDGVVHQAMSKYAWTHWARPKWPNDDSQLTQEVMQMDVLYEARVSAQNGNTVNMRKEPGGTVVAKVPLGTTVQVYAETAGWCKIEYDNQVGYMQSAFLKQSTSFEADVLAKLDEILKRLQE